MLTNTMATYNCTKHVITVMDKRTGRVRNVYKPSGIRLVPKTVPGPPCDSFEGAPVNRACLADSPEDFWRAAGFKNGDTIIVDSSTASFVMCYADRDKVRLLVPITGRGDDCRDKYNRIQGVYGFFLLNRIPD